MDPQQCDVEAMTGRRGGWKQVWYLMRVDGEHGVARQERARCGMVLTKVSAQRFYFKVKGHENGLEIWRGGGVN